MGPKRGVKRRPNGFFRLAVSSDDLNNRLCELYACCESRNPRAGRAEPVTWLSDSIVVASGESELHLCDI
jgi:hypothetical protein